MYNLEVNVIPHILPVKSLHQRSRLRLGRICLPKTPILFRRFLSVQW